MFDRIRREQGHLDLLVNNAWSGYEIEPDSSLAFWESPWRHWDLMFTGGLRAAAFAAWQRQVHGLDVRRARGSASRKDRACRGEDQQLHQPVQGHGRRQPAAGDRGVDELGRRRV